MTAEHQENRAGAQLQSQHAKHDRMLLAAALEQAEETVAIAGTDGIISYVNPAFKRLTGFSNEEVVGRRLDTVFDELTEDGSFEEKWTAISKGQRWHGRIRRKNRTGEMYEVAASVTPIHDSENRGEVVAYVIVERDLTNEIRIEKQMRQSQKMESLGTLAGGIAHDLNNILMPIVLNAELLLEQIPKSTPYRAALEKILNAAHRGRDLVKQVVTFSRRGEQERSPLRLQPLIKEASALVRASLPADIEIKCRLDNTERMVDANPSQIHQVLLNLCSNAADAIGTRRGTVEIHLEEAILVRHTAAAHSLKPGRHLRLSVKDDGAGIEPSLIGRIFEPFFTTKGPGEGTGMGLAMVHGIITHHKGVVDVVSTPGEGSTFHVYLPCVETGEPMEGPLDDGIPRGTGHILVIDDNAEIKEAVTETLEGLGYSVEGLCSPEEALERFEASPDEYDLVLTDQTMRGIKGMVLAERIHRLNPRTPIIVCSGHIDYVDIDRLKQKGVVNIMMKPVTRGELARAVSRALKHTEK